jgi:hypothetical protein
VVLPTAVGNAGQTIGFRVTSTKLITLDGAGSETIDGSPTRIMWAGESAVLISDGSNWHKIGGKTIPLVCQLTRSSSDLSYTTGWTVVPMDAQAIGPSFLFSGGQFVAARPGTYESNMFAYVSADSGLSFAYFSIKKNSTDAPNGYELPVSVAAGQVIAGEFESTFALAAGDTINAEVNVPTGSTIVVFGGAQPAILTVVEIPSW